MMRVLLSLIVLLGSATSFAANTNPLMRVCRLAQGTFWVLQPTSGRDDLPLCFFGSSAVGAEALLGYKTGEGNSQSIQVYQSGPGLTCEQAGATTVQGRDTNGQVFEVCRFFDGSLIEKYTLMRGQGSDQNNALDRALNGVY